MNFDFSKLKLDKLKEWESQLRHLSKNHSCPNLKKKYKALHTQCVERIVEFTQKK